MTPADYRDALAEIDERLTENTDAFMNAQAKLDADKAELRALEDGWPDMLVNIAIGRKEADTKVQARARLRDLRHEVSDGDILVDALQRRIRGITERRANLEVALRDAEHYERQREIEVEAKRLDAEGVPREKIMEQLHISRDHLRKIVPEVRVIGPTGGYA